MATMAAVRICGGKEKTLSNTTNKASQMVLMKMNASNNASGIGRQAGARDFEAGAT